MSDLGVFCRVAIFLVVTFIGACKEDPVDQSGTFTLSTGVSILQVNECMADDVVTAPTLERDGADYIVSVQSVFDCSDEVRDAYLTVSRDKKSTLTLGSTKRKSGCECSRAVRVRISDRLEPGETLYLLGDGEVVGHMNVPLEGRP